MLQRVDLLKDPASQAAEKLLTVINKKRQGTTLVKIIHLTKGNDSRMIVSW
jgi:hypothetical protein